jgi:hypothetical protein
MNFYIRCTLKWTFRVIGFNIGYYLVDFLVLGISRILMLKQTFSQFINV